MLELLKSMNWKGMAGPIFFYLLSALVVYAIVPNLGKIPTVTGKFFDWLSDQAAHIKNQYMAGVLARASSVVRDNVILLENTEIEVIKDLAAGGHYKTKDDLKAALVAVKQKAIDMANANFTATNLMKDLLFVFNDPNALTTWLGHQVETHVSTLPPSGLQTDNAAVAALPLKVVEPPKPVEVVAPVVAPVDPPKAA